MTAFVPFGSTPLASDRLPDEQMYANDGSFVRGVRAGVYGMGSGLRNAAGAVADAFDFDNFAAQQYGEADRLAQKAGRVGPRISSLEQLGNEGYSLSNIGDYALGTMGSALPSMGVGIGATLASGGALLPSLAASTLAYTPMEMGDAVAKWRQANPGQQIDGGTALRLAGTGALSAGAQSIVPAAVGGKLAGRGLASAPVAGFKQAATRNLAEIPMEGFTEGLGEGIKQVGATPEAPLDWGQIGENAVAGAIGGAPMAGIGTLGDYAHGNRQAVADTASRAAKAVGKALEPAQRAAEGAKTATEKGFGDAWTAMSDLGESAWKGASESDLGKTLSERVANTQQRVRAILDDPEVPAEWKAKVEAAAKTAGNKASAAMVWAVDSTRNKVKQAREEGIRKTTLDTLRSSVDAVINGDYLGNKADLANGTDQQVSTRLRESATKAMGAAKAWGEDLLRRKDVDDATKAEVNDAMGNPDDPTGPQRIAAKWKLYDAKDKMVQGFQDIKARFKKGFDSASEDPNAPKKSEDYSGVRAVIGEALRPHMVKINEAVGKDPKALEEVADSLRTYIEAVTDAEGKKTDAVDRGFARMKLTQLLGDDAAGIMADVAEAVGRGQTREQTDRVFEELNELQALQRSHGDLVKMMTRALPKEQRGEVYADIERVVRWATGADVQGKDASQNEIKFRNQKMEADLQRKYGAKAKAIMTQVEQMLSPKQGTRYDPEADRLAAEQDGVDYEAALTEKDDPAESSFFGSGTNRKGLVLNPEVHAARNPAFAGKGTANELIKKLQIENPDAQVKFVALTDRPEMLDRIPAEKRRVTMEAKRLEQEMPGAENAEKRQKALQAFRDARVVELKQDGMGMIEVSRLPNGKLTADEIDAMRMDTNSYGAADHPSRLEIKPAGADKAEHVFDATRVTKVAMKRINREREWTKGDDIDQLTRMGRAFSDGAAALMQEFGRFKIASGLVIGHINGKPITAREALEVDKRTDKDLRTDDQTMEAVDIRKRLRELEGAAESKADAKAVRDEIKELRGRLEYLENSRQGRINSDLAAKTIEDIEGALNNIKKRLVTENSATEREKLVKEMDYLTRRLDDMNERAMYDKSFQDGARQDADPNGNIHEASARLSEGELQARQNMDGSTKTVPTTYVANAKPLVIVAANVRKAGGIGEVLANRLLTLAKNFPMISEKDQRELLALQGASQPSAIGETVNRLARKYADRIAAPKGSPAEFKYSPKGAKARGLTADEIKALGSRKEGTPDPKAQAAQEAALQQATSAGDAPAILQALVARFAPDMQIEIGDREVRGNGRLVTHTDGTFTIYLKEGLTPVQVASTLAHEFGHALMKHKFSTAPATVRNEIMAAYRADVEAAKGGSVQELAEKFGHVAGRINVDGKTMSAAEVIARRDAKAGWEGYTLSFDEWFANQVSKHVTSGGFDGLGPEAKGFWQQVLQTLKDVYRALAEEMRPAPSFEQWMNQLAKQAELRTTEKQEQVLREAIEGDKALIDAMTASTDVQKLQRVVGFLNNFSGMGKVDDTIDAANNRLRELVKDEGQAYHAQTRKYSLLSTQIHSDLDREGFAATHDSPHRHEGKFDWRSHQGKGEGNAAFGAGTYLSTADGVHKSYKKQFTAKMRSIPKALKGNAVEAYYTALQAGYATPSAIRKAIYDDLTAQIAKAENDPTKNHMERINAGRWLRQDRASLENVPDSALNPEKSPTYEVSVNIKPEQLLDWDTSLGDQMEASKTLDRAIYEMAFDDRIDTSVTVDIGDSGVGAFGEPDPVQVQLAEIFESIINDEPMRYGDLGYATGKDVYKGLTKALGSQAAASDYLQSLGILGHKYAASGGKNDAHPNYVIYDDSRITTNYVHFSQDKVNRQQYPNAGPSEPLSAKAIRDHLFKVLGDTVQVEFANLMYAGDFTRQDGEDIIRISVHALNPTTVAYHESLHAFFQQLKDKGLPDVVQAVFKGLNTPHIMRQLRERLKDSPEALAQLSDPEERAAYAYQFWASDPTFKLTAAPRTVFEKIAAAIRKVLGVWSNDERALEIFEYFHSGKYQQQSASKLAIHTATMRAGRNSTVDTAAHMVKPLKKLGDAIVGAGGERLRDSGIPALRELADLIKLRGTDEGRDGGFIQAARLARTEHMNWLATHLQEYGADALNEALEAMQAGRKASTTQAKIVQKLVQEKFLRQMMFDKYLPDAGVKLGDLGADYFPRVWDPAYISKNQEAFAEMLESYGVKNADAVIQKIVSGNGTEWGFDDNAQIEIERPGFVNTRERKLAFISGEDALPFLQKDFWKTMDNYVTQATRRGEWSRRFGYKNEKFDGLLGRAVRQGATPEQIEMAKDFAKAVDGTLGDDIDPSYRRLMGNMVVYQNLRLLPLAIFSSLVDPLGIIVRGGTVRDGWDTFKRGIKEMRKSWQKEPKFDADTMLAEEIGTIEDAMLQHTISSMYGQGMMGDTAQKINDLFFRYNLMEGFNRSMRVGATQAALGFIGRHAKGANEHSTRYLAELGLKAGEVKFDDDGKVVIDERVKLAVNRWVDGAVLRPNAAETPIWMHDPHYALFAHLKQFAFAFHHTFLKRVWHEYQHGNYKPVMALASFVPMMMAADFVKDMLTNGGDEPEWKRQWTFMDHVGYGVERAGILGVGQFALDGIGDIRHGGTGIGALGGPTLDQLTDAVSVLGGRREFGSFALRSMPANSLYRGYVGPADEMEFEGDSMN